MEKRVKVAGKRYSESYRRLHEMFVIGTWWMTGKRIAITYEETIASMFEKALS